MKIEPVNIKLKNSKEVELREARLEDAKKFIEVLKIYCEESVHIPYNKGEFNCTVEEQEKKIQHFLDSKNSILILATFEGEIIGNLDINGSDRQAMHHTGGIGMGMLDVWRNLGIGTALFEQAIKWAKEKSPLELLWLSAYATNDNGLALYKKMGFMECGRMSNYFKIENGDYADDITMILNIKENR